MNEEGDYVASTTAARLRQAADRIESGEVVSWQITEDIWAPDTAGARGLETRLVFRDLPDGHRFGYSSNTSSP